MLCMPLTSGHGGAQSLGYPPSAPRPGMLAIHHAMADVVEDRGRHLDGNVERCVTGEGAQHGVEFLARAARDDAARGPSVESTAAPCWAMLRPTQSGGAIAGVSGRKRLPRS